MRRTLITSRILSTLAIFIAVTTSCGTFQATESLESIESWTQTQARQGFVGRDLDDPLAGFTINLPSGWWAGEDRPKSGGASGWIAAPAQSGEDRVPVLRWSISGELGSTVEELQEDDRYVVSLPEVEGRRAVLYMAAPDAVDEGVSIGVYYQQIPGRPINAWTPSLLIVADSRDFTDQELLRAVLLSVRYKELETLPELPQPAVTPAPDWTRVSARPNDTSFSLMLPPGWTTEEERGIDSRIGSISGDGIKIEYDFGLNSYFPYSFTSKIRSSDYIPHLLWEEDIDGVKFWLVKPESQEPHEEGSTGIYVQFTDERQGWHGPVLLGTISRNLSGEQQELALAILRTVELETENP